MSKKITIPSNNLRNSLVNLFHSFIMNRPKLSSSHRKSHLDEDDYDDDEIRWLMSQGYEIYDYGDDDYVDDYDVVWPPKHSKSKSKHRKRHKCKHKGARIVDLSIPFSGEEEESYEHGGYDSFFSPYEDISDEDDGILDGKEIYYYPDYHDKDNRLEFETLSGFNDFCDENGYIIPMDVGNRILYNRISHTCLNPSAREYGAYEIMAEDSYGSMFYEVCEENELA